MHDEREIRKLASRQHALVTTWQLRELGLTPAQVEHRARVGLLDRVHRGVYRIGGSVPSLEQEALAACLATGGTVGASHRCAAALWDVDLPGGTPIEVAAPVDRRARLQGVRVYRSVDLTPAQITTHRGVPATNPLRLLVDLGDCCSAPLVANALDDLIGRKLVTLRGVRRTLDDLAARGRNGAGVLRRVLDDRDVDEQFSRSRLEALLLRLCQQAGLPGMQFQYPILMGGRRRRIDFALPELLIAIEVDGYATHSRYDVFEDDRVRKNELELAGWTVLQFTYRQVRSRPAYVVDVLHRILAARAA